MDIKKIPYICAALALASPAEAMDMSPIKRQKDSITSRLVDSDKDGVIDQIVTEAPRPDGVVIKDVVQYDKGALLRILTQTYDKSGNKLREVQDWDCDGKPDIVWTREIPGHKLPSPARYTSEELKVRLAGLRSHSAWLERRLKLVRRAVYNIRD